MVSGLVYSVSSVIGLVCSVSFSVSGLVYSVLVLVSGLVYSVIGS